jgi:MRG-binding protein
MIAIATALSSHGFASTHTRIPGIWAKLRTLYDLDALDEREKNHIGIHPHNSSASPEAENGEDNETEHREWDEEFSLPEDQFGELMWTRRFNNEKGHEILAPSRTKDADDDVQRDRASSTPPAIEGLNEMRDYLLSAPETEGLREMLGQLQEDEEEENTSVKDKGKKTTVGKAVKGRSARSTRSTPADEPEEDEDEEEEQRKAKPKRKRRR